MAVSLTKSPCKVVLRGRHARTLANMFGVAHAPTNLIRNGYTPPLACHNTDHNHNYGKAIPA